MVNVIGTLTKGITAVVYVFTLLPQLGEAVAALVQLCTDIPTACANMQSMLDAIAPNLLPCAFLGLVFYLIKVKKWTTIKLVLLTIALGIVLSVLHIVA